MFMRAGKKALIAKRLLLAAMTAALIGGTASTAFAAEPKMSSRLVNGSMENFSYNRVAGIATPPSIYADTYIDVRTGRFYYTTYGNVWHNIPNWNFSEFGWTSTQPGGTFDGYQVPAGTVQINYDRATHNAYAELTIHTDSAIYQDVATTPLSVYKWTLKHSSYFAGHDDSMQVMIGAPGRETAQQATRIAANGAGDALGNVGTVIKTHNVNGAEANYVASSWETYSGTYLVPAGQTVTRFTFKAIDGYTMTGGNNLDDIQFAISYPVNFDSNGGSSIGFNPMANNYAGYVMEGGSATLSSLTTKTPTRRGYTFLGWSETKMSPFTSQSGYEANKGRITNSVSMNTKGKTVYAVWGKNPTMTFLDRGSTVSSAQVSFGGTTSGPQAPTRTGYDFTGWSPAIPGKVYSDWSTTAQWSPRTYTLTYVKNSPDTASVGDSDVVISKGSQTAKYDSAWGELATASKPGYVFEGWYTQASGGSKITPSTVVKGNLTAYAHWRPIEYTIRFLPNAENGAGTVKGEMASVKVRYDASLKLPKNKFVKTTVTPPEDEGGQAVENRSVFKGWNRNPLSLKEGYADEATVMNLTNRDGDTIDLYAIWDDTPNFDFAEYPDRYFTLEEAQAGDITEEELLSTVKVYDRETNLIPTVPSDKLTGKEKGYVTVVGYDADEFIGLTDDASVTVRYEVVDESGNKAYLNAVVTVTRNGALPKEEVEFYRSISDDYRGGLADASRWRNDDLYRSKLDDAMSGSARTHSLTVDSEGLRKAREHVGDHGFGNSVVGDALSSLFELLFPGE